MSILATLPGLFNRFSSMPSNPGINEPNASIPPSLPIPIPKYPKVVKSRRTQKPLSQSEQPSHNSSNPAFKSVHRRTKYHKPVSDGVIASDGDRAVVVGESGVSYLLPGAPFEFQFSYSETPKVKPLAIREPAFLPFAPQTMPRPWTGKAPLKEKKKKIPLFDSFNPPPPETKGVKHLEMPRPFVLGEFPKEGKTREEILGKPLTKAEVRALVKPLLSHNRQVNLGRDGLTHNMLELIHSHWRRQPVCKVRCRGVPTVDMRNVCHHLEEKAGGKIIHQVGGVIYLFRGRNYDHQTRPRYPIMLWKPATPVYPKLIQEAPEGLTKLEADDLRAKGKSLLPICKLAKNGVYINLVKDVRNAFEESTLVKIDCTGMHASDYKKIGAKLKELVPCVLLSFDDEQILMWRGRYWKSMSADHSTGSGISSGLDCTGKVEDARPVDRKTEISSHRMMSLWKQAIESGKAIMLDDIDVGPDALLDKVEAFSCTSQATEHSYSALVFSTGDTSGMEAANADGVEADAVRSDDFDEDNFGGEGEDEDYFSDSFEEESIPLGSLPVDSITERFL
ncbi:PREDICTED: CRS2-associated factor 2, chloroplastic [Nelumbo nucifera]|uniref:CRS2-associated factor 2, chloroplastic n=2 Tax=Nelumbo nucifera TaxID=4432 RepID=A0A1U8ASL5_NELNU|nr:PREDICTED: CRS2-associated factor 2, chloroplastic [Nelumbo nucifera]DAD38413.1 TPA_asm: hypothetical protein HUJ06_009054 [Nelumbo nucifera]